MPNRDPRTETSADGEADSPTETLMTPDGEQQPDGTLGDGMGPQGVVREEQTEENQDPPPSGS